MIRIYFEDGRVLTGRDFYTAVLWLERRGWATRDAVAWVSGRAA